MKYILSKEEYDELVSKQKLQILADTKKLQEFCTTVANEMPLLYRGNIEKKTWGCILSTPHEWYCDRCPAQEFCPHPRKQWSK